MPAAQTHVGHSLDRAEILKQPIAERRQGRKGTASASMRLTH
jgi:hypothetical protein